MCWRTRHTVWSQRPDAQRVLVTSAKEHADDGENKTLITTENTGRDVSRNIRQGRQIKSHNLPWSPWLMKVWRLYFLFISDKKKKKKKKENKIPAAISPGSWLEPSAHPAGWWQEVTRKYQPTIWNVWNSRLVLFSCWTFSVPVSGNFQSLLEQSLICSGHFPSRSHDFWHHNKFYLHVCIDSHPVVFIQVIIIQLC